MNTKLNRELQYITVEMATIVTHNIPLMNEERRTIYDRIMLAVSAVQSRFYFFNAPGGTGKTFLISPILAEIMASHWPLHHLAFRQLYFINIQNNPDAVCNVKKQSSMATVLKQCKIILWDECTMA